MAASSLFDFLPRNSSTSRLMVIVDEDDEDLGCPSSPSSSESSGAEDDGDSGTSSSASLGSHTGGSPLYEMSDLVEDLPLKRGLSRHFNGKSQSFTSLANARCLQDLVKPMRRPPPSSSKPMRSCRSYASGLDHHQQHGHGNHPHSPKGSIAKRPVRNNSFHASRPPMHPHSSANLAGQTLLFT